LQSGKEPVFAAPLSVLRHQVRPPAGKLRSTTISTRQLLNRLRCSATRNSRPLNTFAAPSDTRKYAQNTPCPLLPPDCSHDPLIHDRPGTHDRGRHGQRREPPRRPKGWVSSRKSKSEPASEAVLTGRAGTPSRSARRPRRRCGSRTKRRGSAFRSLIRSARN
jgi:hypothetical protein